MINKIIILMWPAALASATITANQTAVPGVVPMPYPNNIFDDGADANAKLSVQSAPPSWTVTWGYATCGNYDDYYGITKFYQPAGCSDWTRGPPQWVCWDNPSNPNDPNSLPYWNMIMYFDGDECPVIGHPFQCDTVGKHCLCLTGSRPLSWNVVEATTGVRNCDSPF